MKKIAFVCTFFSQWKWPCWFNYFLESCRYNPTIDWFLFSDCGSRNNLPENVKIIPLTFKDFKKLAAEKLKLKINFDIPYKICDFKPTYGKIYEEYLKDYDFWGHTDIDLIYGNIRKFITDDMLEEYDLISSAITYVCGHFTLFKNSEKMKYLYTKSRHHKQILQAKKHCVFDEVMILPNKFKSKNPVELWAHFAGGEDVRTFNFRWEDMTHTVLRLGDEGYLKYFFKSLEAGLSYIKKHEQFWLWRGKVSYLWDKGTLINYSDNKEHLYFHFHWLKGDGEWLNNTRRSSKELTDRSKFKLNAFGFENLLEGFDIHFLSYHRNVHGSVMNMLDLQQYLVDVENKKILFHCYDIEEMKDIVNKSKRKYFSNIEKQKFINFHRYIYNPGKVVITDLESLHRWYWSDQTCKIKCKRLLVFDNVILTFHLKKIKPYDHFLQMKIKLEQLLQNHEIEEVIFLMPPSNIEDFRNQYPNFIALPFYKKIYVPMLNEIRTENKDGYYYRWGLGSINEEKIKKDFDNIYTTDIDEEYDEMFKYKNFIYARREHIMKVEQFGRFIFESILLGKNVYFLNEEEKNIQDGLRDYLKYYEIKFDGNKITTTSEELKNKMVQPYDLQPWNLNEDLGSLNERSLKTEIKNG